jgi:hypothetical protein
MTRTAKSPGLTLRKLGGVVISIGRRRAATVNAVCTSSAALSMFRLSSNWTMIEVRPSAEVEVSEVMPDMVDSCRSIGDATDAAMVSALAPGSCALIWMVGKSTAGSAATPRSRYAKTPKTRIVAVISVVSTGRRMHSSDKPMVRTQRWSGEP